MVIHNDRKLSNHPTPYQGDKRSDLQDGLPGDGGGARGVGFSPILAHGYKSCPRQFNLRRNTGSIYRRAYESAFNAGETNGLGFEGLLLMVGAAIAIFFFGV